MSAAQRVGRLALPLLSLWPPPCLGAFLVLALVVWGLSEPLVSDHERVLGDNTSKANAWVTIRYARDIIFVQCELAAIAIVLGSILGCVAGCLVSAASWTAGRGSISRLGLALWSLVLTTLFQCGLGAWSMARDPQFYADAWYARGGAWRAIQETISDRLGPAKIAGLFGFLALAHLCGVVVCARLRSVNVQPTNRGMTTPSRIAVVPVLLAGTLLVVGLPLCDAAHCKAAQARRFDRTGRHPNLLILAADSLRNDHLDPALTPHLAGVAARGTRFTRAYVSQARTFPSWTTMLTGLYPHHHGIRSDFPRWEERMRSFDTIASRFARAGYATHVVSDYGGDIFNLVDFGFEDVRAPRVDFRQYLRLKGLERARALLPILHTRFGRAIEPAMREAPRGASADLLADDAIAALSADDPRPFFMVVFFSAPHYPYASRAPYFKRFAVPHYEGLYKYYKPVWYADADPGPLDVAQIRGLYKGAVASVDDAAGRILRELSARGEDEHTIVAVLSDHGEDLFEDGRWHGHGDHLFGDAQTHIPLIIADPRRPGTRVCTDLVASVDLAQTLCELVGVAPPSASDGRSLVPALDGQPVPPGPVFAESGLWIGQVRGFSGALRIQYPSFLDLAEADQTHRDEFVLRTEYGPVTTFAKHRMVFDGRYKLVYAPTPQGPKYLLFDRESDPAENNDLAGRERHVFNELRETLWGWMLQDRQMENRGGYLAPRRIRIDVVDDPLAKTNGDDIHPE